MTYVYTLATTLAAIAKRRGWRSRLREEHTRIERAARAVTAVGKITEHAEGEHDRWTQIAVSAHELNVDETTVDALAAAAHGATALIGPARAVASHGATLLAELDGYLAALAEFDAAYDGHVANLEHAEQLLLRLQMPHQIARLETDVDAARKHYYGQ